MKNKTFTVKKPTDLEVQIHQALHNIKTIGPNYFTISGSGNLGDPKNWGLNPCAEIVLGSAQENCFDSFDLTLVPQYLIVEMKKELNLK